VRSSFGTVQGKNGATVYDELTKLGLTNLQLASRDAEDKVVVLPSNWTAVKIEPKAGTTVKSNQVVVVTMTKGRCWSSPRCDCSSGACSLSVR
jgi:hypothetical protein